MVSRVFAFTNAEGGREREGCWGGVVMRCRMKDFMQREGTDH